MAPFKIPNTLLHQTPAIRGNEMPIIDAVGFSRVFCMVEPVERDAIIIVEKTIESVCQFLHIALVKNNPRLECIMHEFDVEITMANVLPTRVIMRIRPEIVGCGPTSVSL